MLILVKLHLLMRPIAPAPWLPTTLLEATHIKPYPYVQKPIRSRLIPSHSLPLVLDFIRLWIIGMFCCCGFSDESWWWRSPCSCCPWAGWLGVCLAVAHIFCPPPFLHQFLHEPNLPNRLILDHIIYINDIRYITALVIASS